MKSGKIFFISGPSAVGKGTLISALKKNNPEFVFPPSCTTRAPRPGEKEGETYFFITQEVFKQKIEAGEFLEYACVHGKHFYGTLKDSLLEPVEEGKTVIREFDVQGFEQAKERLERSLFVSIFLKPAEDIDDLVDRIKKRAPISDEDIAKRVESMKKEIEKAPIYDYVILSERGKIEKLVSDATNIITKNS